MVNGERVQMTPQEEADFLADQQIATNNINTENTTEINFKTALKNLLTPIVGKKYDTITAAETRLLVALLMHSQFKAIDRTTGNYKPLNQWIV